MYTEKVMEHFRHPRNVGRIEEPSGMARVGDPSCGDSIELYIKVESDRIVDIKYMIYGCPASIATSSVTSEIVKGKTIDEALSITDDDVIRALGGLPENKGHCSLLSITALHYALNDYFLKEELKGDAEGMRERADRGLHKPFLP